MSNFYCTNCGTLGIPIIRPQFKKREVGHLKVLYCCNCKKETNHAEVSGYNYTYEDFLKEFNYGHFKNGIRIGFEQLNRCKNIKCSLYFHGRCWDARENKSCKEC